MVILLMFIKTGKELGTYYNHDIKLQSGRTVNRDKERDN